MSTQVSRFIDIQNDNYSHLLQVWDNVRRKFVLGEKGVTVPLGIDFKLRSKNRSNLGSPVKVNKVSL